MASFFVGNHDLPMFYTYILHSSKLDKYYIGYTESLGNRFAYHNNVAQNKIWTRTGIPWRFVVGFRFPTSKEAMGFERKLKASKSRKLIEELARTGMLPPDWGFGPELVRAADPDLSG
jgi:putative endonuclease